MGSELLASGALQEALQYILVALEERPDAFAWSRMGKLCREAGRPDLAVHCYEQALLLAPGDRFAIVGRAAALAECSDVEVGELVETFLDLADLVRNGDPRPVAWTAYAVMRAVSRRFPHPAVEERTRAMRAIALALDPRTPGERQRELEERLERVLRTRAILGNPESHLAVTAGVSDEPRLLSAPPPK